ncbi:MAG: flavin monoamine oxidase family protein [Micromonosporaceae bacterium]
MARTSLFATVQRLAEEVATERRAGRRPPAMSRRQLLKTSATVGAGLAALAASGRASAASSPRIVVIGAGLAGLTAAYELRKAGFAATVYEAGDRLGGRCWTDRDTWADGQISERGGELIDQGHNQIRNLAQELGLDLANLLAAEPNGSEDRYYFGGAVYPYEQAKSDLQRIYQQLHGDASAASYPTLYNSYTPRGFELDHMSIRDWINSYVPGGIGSRLGQLLDVAYCIEYGADTSVQSSLNLIYLLAYQGAGNIRIFGKSNEKYHVVGGNDLLVSRLAAALPGQIQTGSALTALTDRGDGTWGVTVTVGHKTSTVIADRVILALPFSLLRQVDLNRANFPARKMKAIMQLPMGTNSKLQLQFGRRLWYDLGNNGATYADTGYQSTWEVSRAQAGPCGILVDYTGGTVGNGFGPPKSPTQYAQRFLGQLEPVLPGIAPLWNGRVSLNYWAGYPWTLGSYSYWAVGQYTTITGSEREAVRTCHFAGEHTSVDFQGYLNGAVESGQRAAGEVIAALGR